MLKFSLLIVAVSWLVIGQLGSLWVLKGASKAVCHFVTVFLNLWWLLLNIYDKRFFWFSWFSHDIVGKVLDLHFSILDPFSFAFLVLFLLGYVLLAEEIVFFEVVSQRFPVRITNQKLIIFFLNTLGHFRLSTLNHILLRFFFIVFSFLLSLPRLFLSFFLHIIVCEFCNLFLNMVVCLLNEIVDLLLVWKISLTFDGFDSFIILILNLFLLIFFSIVVALLLMLVFLTILLIVALWYI